MSFSTFLRSPCRFDPEIHMEDYNIGRVASAIRSSTFPRRQKDDRELMNRNVKKALSTCLIKLKTSCSLSCSRTSHKIASTTPASTWRTTSLGNYQNI
uniref:Putative FBD-associated F-box protein At5g56700 isoform X1 n=1 Tax=Rhizophora mucronata TaxID=61149 RepID=A0A2P2M864_RHIMU